MTTNTNAIEMRKNLLFIARQSAVGQSRLQARAFELLKRAWLRAV
jgi:hypothetical protein